MPRYWYVYVPGLNPDPTLPANYRYTPFKPSCAIGSTICAIYSGVPSGYPANFFTILPSISDRLQNYIINGLSTHAPQPIVPRFFVYLKS
ncbi:hypothetical protein SAMN05443550_1352 [Pedobacter hartonius]|uniref:Uncharacterized protein n=1 Tax=Pedobacter hartonius TaxID=425514 RepID=A0A1H4HKT7_9SPHI|nr:hypothetical protein SAMN05443550_1352 [Pedobacter hartonius]